MSHVILLIRVSLMHMRDRRQQVFASVFFFHCDLRNTLQCASTLAYSDCFFFSIEYMFSLIINETQDLFFPFNRGQVLDPILAILHCRTHTSVLGFLHLCENPHVLILIHGNSTNQIHLKPPGHRPRQTVQILLKDFFTYTLYASLSFLRRSFQPM